IKGSRLDCSERAASRSFTPAIWPMDDLSALSSMHHLESVLFDAACPREPAFEKFLLTWLVVDDRVAVAATETRECGHDFARLGRFQGSQRDDADMPVRFRPNGSLQPLRSLSRTVQHRDVEEHIVHAVRKLWTPRLPIGDFVDRLD